jgi:hypothetical protein
LNFSLYKRITICLRESPRPAPAGRARSDLLDISRIASSRNGGTRKDEKTYPIVI